MDASLDHLPQRKRDDLAKIAAMVRQSVGDDEILQNTAIDDNRVGSEYGRSNQWLN